MDRWEDGRRIALALSDTGERFMHNGFAWHAHKGSVWVGEGDGLRELIVEAG